MDVVDHCIIRAGMALALAQLEGMHNSCQISVSNTHANEPRAVIVPGCSLQSSFRAQAGMSIANA